jgi:hypothetical protein
VTGEAAISEPARRLSLRELGMAVSIALAVLYGVVVEDMGLLMIRNHAGDFAFVVLGLFATPLLTTWVAIAIWLAAQPRWAQLTVAALLLLAPPLILFGMLDA